MAVNAHSETTCCLNCKGDHYASSKSCPVWIREKEIQRVKTEKCLSYGDARRLVTSSSSSSSTAPSYASAVKTVARKVTMNIECQTPAFWIGKQPTLLEASKLPSVQTVSTGSGTNDKNTTNSVTHRQMSPSASSEKRINQKPRSHIKETKNKPPNKEKDIETSNKFQSLSSHVDEEMDTTQSSRPSRSHSRSRSRSKNISPVTHR